MIRLRGLARFARLLLVVVVLAARASPAEEGRARPSASVQQTDPGADAARLVARKFVAGWRGRRYERMTELLAPSGRARDTPEAITGPLRQFDELAGVTRIVGEVGPAIKSSVPGDG